MNLAVSYFVNGGDRGILESAGSHQYFFDHNFEAVAVYSDDNNLYLGVNYAESKIYLKAGYEEFGGFEYFFRTESDEFMTISRSFCNDMDSEGTCNRKGYIGNYVQIDGYFLKLSSEQSEALIFKLKLISDEHGGRKKCYTTTIRGNEFILTYHPHFKKLVLSTQLMKSNSYYSPNNILFVTDNEELCKNLKMINLPPYKNLTTFEYFKNKINI